MWEGTVGAGVDYRPATTPDGRSLHIEVLPPAPVPRKNARPQAPPETKDRITGTPLRLAGRPPEASWIFPIPTRPGAQRVASSPDHPGLLTRPIRR